MRDPIHISSLKTPIFMGLVAALAVTAYSLIRTGALQ